MGLIVSVYTNKSRDMDCTNNGVTNRFTRLCVDNVEGPFDPSDDCPAVVLTKGYMDGTAMLVPLETRGKHSMFGGNYASTSDSRFGRAVEKITGNRFYGAVAVHDRVE